MRRERMVSNSHKTGNPMFGLPVRAVYTVAQLAKAASIDRRTMRGILEKAGVRLFPSGTSWWVPLSELELKVPPLWESIKTAEMLRHGVEET